MEATLRLFFLFLKNVNIKFAKKPGKLTWRSYTITEILPNTSQIKLIDKIEFVKIVLD